MSVFKTISTCLVKAPISGLYGTGVYVRNKLYDWGMFKSTSFNFPIINVGNITVGGTGKTPHIEYILLALSKENKKTAVLSRGYKRQSKGFRYVEIGDTAELAGDEPLQIKQKYPLATVAVNANRVEGVQRLLEEINGLQCILLDDGFQHRRIKPKLNIVLMDYSRPVYDDKMLPWGQLRDNKAQLKRADILIVSKCPQDIQPIELRMISKYMNLYPYQQLYFTTLHYGEKVPIFDDVKQPEVLLGNGVVAIAGIAKPAPFVSYIEKHYGAVIPMLFADHHNYTENDIKRICTAAQKAAIVLTTEKDTMRLRSWAHNIPDEIKAKMYYLPIQVRFIRDEDKFLKNIIDYVRTNKSDSRLY